MGTDAMKEMLTIAAMAALALFVLSTWGTAVSAQTPSAAPDSLPFVQASTACVHRTGDASEKWRRTWQRAQLWSLYYGYSLAQTFSRASDTRPANCGANMDRLDAALTKAEITFAGGWRGVQRNARTNLNAGALLKLAPDYAWGWCAATVAAATPIAKFDPAQLGLDPSTPEGKALAAGMLAEFDGLLTFYDQRSFQAEPAGDAGKRRARDEYLRAQTDFEAYRASITRSGEIVQSVVKFANGKDTPFAAREAARLFLTTELAACRTARRLDE